MYARSIRQLDWLHRKGSISLAQFTAGDRLYRDFKLSGSEQRITMWWAPPSTRGGNLHDTTTSLRARERFEGALREAGQLGADVLMHVAICDLAPTNWARLNGVAIARGVPMLRHALDALIGFYGVTHEEATTAAA
jgi:Domain of unknown function (DUF6456)